jgi:acetyl/propionyl-CoA carboxylase alpha subunit
MAIRQLLIANRGEIAVRIARSAREQGIGTVAVYSDADETALHVAMCDRSQRIGPAAAAESYLSIPALLEAARASGADAVHPGYGFLSERPAFARAVAEAGLTWVGPTPEAMDAMADKLSARRLMAAAGVPTVPGSEELGPGADSATIAGRLGYPVLVKATAGGGGKGMRRVDAPEDLPGALEACRREAASAFGDGRVYLEKSIDSPRHVEVQIFGDNHGNLVSLHERECSIQRRHQKIVEEAPCGALSEDLRRSIHAAAIEAGRAISYTGAGTVEFLLDRSGRFHFLEMNTRLQVEHPVTEEILGLDLVAAQLTVADGLPLPLEFAAAIPRGHAIECRIYAEDSRTYLPRSGTVLAYREPGGPGVRVDSGIAEGSRVGIDYDPILAKLIVRAESRPAAVAKMHRALADYVILGVTTNLSLLQAIVGSEEFAAGRTDTSFIERLGSWSHVEAPQPVLKAAALALSRPAALRNLRTRGLRIPDPWDTGTGFPG